MSAELDENPPGSDQVELTLRIQGVGPGQPRRIVVPHAFLVENPEIDPDDVVGRGFEAEVEQAGPSRWHVVRFEVSGRVLRQKE